VVSANYTRFRPGSPEEHFTTISLIVHITRDIYNKKLTKFFSSFIVRIRSIILDYGEIMTKKAKQPSDCYIYLLSRAYQKGQGLVQKRLKKFGLTNIQYLVLEVLWKMEGITASETGKILSIDKATLSGVIERMVDSQWIIKRQDENDKRVFQLYPSEKAKQLKEVLIDERKKANDQFLADFTLEERVLLRRLLLSLL